MEVPEHLAGAHVEAANIAWRCCFGRAEVIADARSDYHNIANNHGCRGDGVSGAVGLGGPADAQIDDAIVAEADDGLPGFCVERKEISVDGSHEDARSEVSGTGPVSDAAMGESVNRCLAGGIAFGVVSPERFAGGGIDGRDLAQAGADV